MRSHCLLHCRHIKGPDKEFIAWATSNLLCNLPPPSYLEGRNRLCAQSPVDRFVVHIEMPGEIIDREKITHGLTLAFYWSETTYPNNLVLNFLLHLMYNVYVSYIHWNRKEDQKMNKKALNLIVIIILALSASFALAEEPEKGHLLGLWFLTCLLSGQSARPLPSLQQVFASAQCRSLLSQVLVSNPAEFWLKPHGGSLQWGLLGIFVIIRMLNR